MPKYIVVYINVGKSYLAKWISGGKIYESVAEGDTQALKRLAEELNASDSDKKKEGANGA